MILIVGLGNPGKKYQNTRHNLGFMVLDKLANSSWIKKDKFKSLVSFLDKDTILVKPQAFMNNSGEAVAKIASFYKIDPSDIWIVHDDLDLKTGQLKIKIGGGTAGHKGLESIISYLKTQDFVRFRLGINHPSLEISVEKYVLLPFKKEERELIDNLVKETREAIKLALKEGLTTVMNRFNK